MDFLKCCSRDARVHDISQAPWRRKNKTRKKGHSMPGRLLATYPLLPSFKYSEKLHCYVDNLDQLDPNIPEPHPPPTKKAEVFDLSRFSDVDARAVNTPASYHRVSLTELVDHLTDGYTDDLSKVRVIYRWITCQPIDRLDIKKEPSPTQALYQLWRIKNKKGNYAQLVSLLCRHADIPCVIIHGTLKGSTYEVGDKIDEDKHYGEWNAVLVDGHWRFINAYWGTCAEGTIDNSSLVNGDVSDDSGLGALYYCCDENYFLTDPHQTVATHLPHIQEWQLKKDPLTLKEFEQMTFVKDRYFNLRLKTLTHHECLVHNDTGELEMKFGVPRQMSLDIDFQYLLFRLRGETETRADQYVFIHRTNNHETLTVKIRTPHEATFRFELVGKDSTIMDENYDYDWIAIYKMFFSKGLSDCMPYPPYPPVGWGPGRAAMNVGIVPLSHFTGEVFMDDYGKAEIRFGAADKRKLGDMVYAAMMYTGGQTPSELPDQVVHRLEDGDIIFNALTPDKGEYVLKLFVKEGGDLDRGKEFCEYLLISKQNEKNNRYPKGFTNRLGAKQPAFSASSLRPTVPSGYLVTDESEVHLGFSRGEDIEMSVNLSGENVKPAEAPLLLSQEEKGDLVKYTVRLPQSGQYGVKIRGTRKDGGLHEPLYDYVIDYRKPKKRTPREPTIQQEAIRFDVKEEKVSEQAPKQDTAPEENGATKLEVCRRRMRMAIEEYDADELQRVIRDLKNLNIASVQDDLKTAEKELEIIQTRNELLTAIREKDAIKLKNALKKVRKAGLEEKFSREVTIAIQLIERIKKLQKLLHAILDLDQSTIAEMKSYSKPPPIVKTVMMATLLLLGHFEEDTKKWKTIQTLLGKIGKESIKRLIAEFKIEECPLEVAMGAKDYLRDHSIDQVRLVSAGAATFYVWVKGVVEEIEKRAGDEINNIRPRTSRSRRKNREMTFLRDVESAP